MPDQPYSSSAFLFEVGVRDPEFRQHCRVWAMLMQSEMMEIVMRTREQIATSRELLVKCHEQPDPWRWKAPVGY